MKYLLRLILPIYVIFLLASEFSEGQETRDLDSLPEPAEIRLDTKMARGVEDHEPVGIDSVFKSDEGRVWCWSNVLRTTAKVDTVYFIWNYNGQQESRVPIVIEGTGFRAASFQTIKPEHTGKWTVYIIDKENNVLGMTKFKIIPEKTSEVVSELP